jgi:hypothetical protein
VGCQVQFDLPQHVKKDAEMGTLRNAEFACLPVGRECGVRNLESKEKDGEIRISGYQGNRGLGDIIECGLPNAKR